MMGEFTIIHLAATVAAYGLYLLCRTWWWRRRMLRFASPCPKCGGFPHAHCPEVKS